MCSEIRNTGPKGRIYRALSSKLVKHLNISHSTFFNHRIINAVRFLNLKMLKNICLGA